MSSISASVPEVSASLSLDDMNTPEFFSRLESYEWNGDTEFLSGLAAILGPDPSSSDQSQIDDLTLRARCFYYAQKFQTHPVDFIAYKAWRAEQPSSKLAPLDAKSTTTEAIVTGHGDPTDQKVRPTQPDYPASFNEVMELIQSGKPIPGIREIPDTVLVGRGTEPSIDRRKKPWERSDSQTTDSQRLFDQTA